MPIVEFENFNDEDLILTVEPWGDEHKISHLVRVGIRYTLKDGAEDRSYTSIRNNCFDFWCNADSYEIEFIHPTPYDLLSWTMCVRGGWCGGIVNDQPTTVDDLLPPKGTVSALEFAKLAIRADGWPNNEPYPQKHLAWIQAKFVEFLGSHSVCVEDLKHNRARAFEKGASV